MFSPLSAFTLAGLNTFLSRTRCYLNLLSMEEGSAAKDESMAYYCNQYFMNWLRKATASSSLYPSEVLFLSACHLRSPCWRTRRPFGQSEFSRASPHSVGGCRELQWLGAFRVLCVDWASWCIQFHITLCVNLLSEWKSQLKVLQPFVHVMVRHSKLQKQVLALYRQFLRAGQNKPGFIPRIRDEFRANAHIKKTDVMYIEYLYRRGQRQLEQLRDVNTKQLGSFSKPADQSWGHVTSDPPEGLCCKNIMWLTSDTFLDSLNPFS